MCSLPQLRGIRGVRETLEISVHKEFTSDWLGKVTQAEDVLSPRFRSTASQGDSEGPAGRNGHPV